MRVYSDNAEVFRRIEANAYKDGFLMALDLVADGMIGNGTWELAKVIEDLRSYINKEIGE